MPTRRVSSRAHHGALYPGSRQFELLFEQAPGMMHVLDDRGRVVKVNRRWVEVMGYRSEEISGQKPDVFLTDSSRKKFVSETFPAFWRRGYAENLEYEFVTKEGRILPVVLDAAVIVDNKGNRFGLGMIRPAIERPTAESAVLAGVMERLEDVALSLRVIARMQEEGLEIRTEQLQELILSAKDIGRNVRDLTDAVCSSVSERSRQPSQRRTK